jgi:hypothetical protein
MTITNLTANAGSDFDLEYKDVVHDSTDPNNLSIEQTVPKKYEGKSVEDLIGMHVNLEKVLHRQGNELGQLRKVVDTQSRALEQAVSRANSVTPETRKAEPLTAQSLLDDPTKAIAQTVAPAVNNLEQRLQSIETKTAQANFEQRHPDFQKDVQDPEFQNWVLGSKTRSKLLVGVHNYDFDAGEALWEMWDEHKAAVTTAKTTREQKIQSATTVRNAASVAPNDSGQIAKPIYSRAKLAELQMRALSGDQAAEARWNDPEFQKEYQMAYAENRVR